MTDQGQGIRVEIYDHVYHLRAAADEEHLRELAKSVDTTMRSLAEKTLTVDSLRLAVLAALHFADQYERLKQRYEKLNGIVSEKSLEFGEALDSVRNSTPID